MAKTKKCRRCRQTLSLDEFVDISGDNNPKGYYCQACHLKRVAKWHKSAQIKEKSYIRKLKIVYGDHWRHYALPEYFRTMLKDERDFCPYCGIRFDDVIPHSFNASPVHVDHMDPLDKGGENSIRNVVLCCGPCNIKKGKRSFQQWLDMLEPGNRELAIALYIEKHGHRPEMFTEGCATDRESYDLEFILFETEEELRRRFPVPKVGGPLPG